MSYVFYDTETTGIEVAFDQILQFAAARTDADLNVVETFNVRSRLLERVLPAPGALLVTGVTVDVLQSPELPTHYEMIGLAVLHTDLRRFRCTSACARSGRMVRSADPPRLRRTREASGCATPACGRR